MKKNLKFKIIAFDMDGTLTEGFSWSLFHKIGGVSQKLQKEWMTKYFKAEITYNDWISLIESKYRKSNKHYNDFLSITNNVPFKKDAHEVVSKLKKHYNLHIVSSSIDIYVKSAAEKLGILTYHANHSFEFNAKGKFEKIKYQAAEADAKVQYLKSLCKFHNLEPREICFVGDSMGDISAFRFTKKGILIGNGNSELENSAWKQTQTLSEILPLLL
jgi:HAD superfamily phosphoserine phosphatase-like hydrolase